MMTRRKKAINVFLVLVVLAVVFRIKFSGYFWVDDIREAIDENDMEKLELLLEKDYDIDTTDYPRSRILRAFFEVPQCTPLDFACKKGSYEAVKMIVDAGADTNGIGENWTPLILTLRKYDADDLQIVKYLIENGADVDQQDGYDYPLTVAADMLIHYEKAGIHYYDEARAENVLEIIKVLLEHTENPEVKNSRSESAFLCASNRGNLSVMKYLVEIYGYDVNERDNRGQTAAFYYYGANDPAWITAKVNLLKELGIDLKIKDNEGRTAYDYTKQQGQYWIADMLNPEE